MASFGAQFAMLEIYPGAAAEGWVQKTNRNKMVRRGKNLSMGRPRRAFTSLAHTHYTELFDEPQRGKVSLNRLRKISFEWV